MSDYRFPDPRGDYPDRDGHTWAMVLHELRREQYHGYTLFAGDRTFRVPFGQEDRLIRLIEEVR